MLPEEYVDKIDTASADKGYDDVKIIKYLIGNGIKPVIDIKNQ